MKNWLQLVTLMVYTITISSVCFSTRVFSQTDSKDDSIIDLDTYVVSAQKRKQSLFEVPININAFQGEFVEESLGVSEFSDLAPFVPGLEIQEQSPNNPGFVIRGITSDSGDTHLEPRVSVYLDGISISDTRTSIVELFDLERIEVAKGPQSTLFGRAAEIGAIHVIQAKANPDLSEGKLLVGAGNYGEYIGQGMGNTPLIENTLAARVAFSIHKRDGYIDNIAGTENSQNPGTDSEALNGLDNRSVKFALAYTPGEKFRLDYLLNFQNDNPSGTSFKSGKYAPTGGDVSPYSAAELNRGNELYIDRTILSHNLTMELQINNNWSLSSVSGFRETDSYENFDADGTAASVLEFAEDVQHEQFSQEFRLNYESNGPLSAFIGVNFFYKNASQRVPFDSDERSLLVLLSNMEAFKPIFTAFGLPTDMPLILPTGEVFAPLQALPNPFAPGSYLSLDRNHHEEYINDSILKTYEIFTDGTWVVNEQLELTTGLRISKEDVTSGYEVIDSTTPGILGLLDTARYPNDLLISTGGTRVSGEESFSGVVGRLAALFKFDEYNQAYASIARGRRPNVLIADETGVYELSDEIVMNYETGIKGLLHEGRISYDASVFYYKYSHFQTSIPNDNPPPLFLQVDAGNATGLGFEITLSANLTKDFSVFGNYAYTDSTFDNEDEDGNPQQFAGNRFRLTPENAFSVGLDYSTSFGDALEFFFLPTYNWKSEVYFENDNDPILSQDAYGLLNIRTGLKLGETRNWEVAFYIQNTLDEEYIIDAGNTGNTFGIPTFISGTPRFYGFRISRFF